MKTILFVCSGNYCRSPLAEGLARLRLQQAGYDGQFLTRSAETLPEYEGQPSATLIPDIIITNLSIRLEDLAARGTRSYLAT